MICFSDGNYFFLLQGFLFQQIKFTCYFSIKGHMFVFLMHRDHSHDQQGQPFFDVAVLLLSESFTFSPLLYISSINLNWNLVNIWIKYFLPFQGLSDHIIHINPSRALRCYQPFYNFCSTASISALPLMRRNNKSNWFGFFYLEWFLILFSQLI